MLRSIFLGSLFLTLPCLGQEASAPDEPMVRPGIPPEERIDLSGDLLADVLITGRTEHIPDPQQDVGGWYRRTVQTLPGSSILLRTTRNNAGHYILEEGAKLDTAALAKGFHFKQLQWSAADGSIEFRVLQHAFTKDMAPHASGWTGTGDHHEGTMVLRSTRGHNTVIVAFNILFDLPAGRIWVTTQEVLIVPENFGEEADPPPPLPQQEEEFFDFGHESEAQMMIPPGLPPEELVDLTSDDVPDVIIAGRMEPGEGTDRSGYYVRGVEPAPGTAFLKQRNSNGVWDLFHLGEGKALTPEELAMGLRNGTLLWADPDQGAMFCALLRHPFGMEHLPQQWTAVDGTRVDLVYRTMSYGQPIIGMVELSWAVPGGALGLDPQIWVKEGEVLKLR